MSTTLADITSRVASITSINRTKTLDEKRVEVHGGEIADLTARVEAYIQQQRKMLADLEKTLS